MSLIENISRNIYPLEKKYMQQAQARLDRLIKPTGSLGKMESICAQLAGIYGKKYFEKCITSILNQTYRNLEIILVDDGSTDGSEKVCDDYAKKESHQRSCYSSSQKSQEIDGERN